MGEDAVSVVQRFFRVRETGQWCAAKHQLVDVSGREVFPDDGREFADRYAVNCGLEAGSLDVIDLADDEADPRDGDPSGWVTEIELPPHIPTPDERTAALEASLRQHLRSLRSVKRRFEVLQRARIQEMTAHQVAVQQLIAEGLTDEQFVERMSQLPSSIGNQRLDMNEIMDSFQQPFEYAESIIHTLRYIDHHLEYLLERAPWSAETRVVATQFREAFESQSLKDLRDLLEHHTNYIIDHRSPITSCGAGPTRNDPSTERGIRRG